MIQRRLIEQHIAASAGFVSSKTIRESFFLLSLQLTTMSKSRSLPSTLKAIIHSPTYSLSKTASSSIASRGSRSPGPLLSPRKEILTSLFVGLQSDATSRGVALPEWLSIATATLITLNASDSLKALHSFALEKDQLGLQKRIDMACLMREVGLKCIGFVGIPKVINNLAALRAAVDEDPELADSLPKEPRRAIKDSFLPQVHKAGYDLWDDIYDPHSSKLIKVLGKSHPDLPIFIIEAEYGNLFASPSSFSPSPSLKGPPNWEVDRLRTSLVAISALRSQGGVAPQVTSHVWGLMKAGKSLDSNVDGEAHRGRKWLTTEEGAEWIIKAVDGICEVVEGSEDSDREPSSTEKKKKERESKL